MLPDLTLKVDVARLKRRPIGFVTRGDYSQARGQGIGIGALADSKDVKHLIEVNGGIQRKQKALIALYRKPNSLQYQACVLSKLKHIS